MNVQFSHFGYIPSTSSGNPHIARQHLDKYFNLEPQNLFLYQLTKNLAGKIALHIYSVLRDLGVIFDKYILSRSPILAGGYRAGTADLLYGTQDKKVKYTE